MLFELVYICSGSSHSCSRVNCTMHSETSSWCQDNELSTALLTRQSIEGDTSRRVIGELDLSVAYSCLLNKPCWTSAVAITPSWDSICHPLLRQHLSPPPETNICHPLLRQHLSPPPEGLMLLLLLMVSHVSKSPLYAFKKFWTCVQSMLMAKRSRFTLQICHTQIMSQAAWSSLAGYFSQKMNITGGKPEPSAYASNLLPWKPLLSRLESDVWSRPATQGRPAVLLIRRACQKVLPIILKWLLSTLQMDCVGLSAHASARPSPCR